MRTDFVRDLADCSRFRQTLMARPPRVTHGTVILLVGLLGMALLWSALTQADLVVRAPGRVRPVVTPKKVVNAARGESLSASAGGRVAAVYFREGDEVRRGALLIRLETGRLDNDIANKRQAIRGEEEELANLKHLEKLTARQFEAAVAKARAELAQAREELRRARDRRVVDIRLAELELATARDEEARLRQLAAARAAAAADLVKATSARRAAAQKLARARLPVDRGRVQVAGRALEQLQRDQAVKGKELALRRQAKRTALAASRLELANLRLERRQAEIRSPLDGIITRGDIKVGDILEAGKAVVEIAEQRGFIFEAAVPSEEIGHLRVGMAVRVKLDAYDYQRYGTVSGKVCFLSPDSGRAEGRPGAVYLVRIALDGNEVGRGEFHGRVKLGMAGQAEILTGEEPLLSLLLKRIRQTISLG
jgi:multidrug resistance efflux pump